MKGNRVFICLIVSCAESGKICHWTTHCLSWSGPNWQYGTILSQTSIPRYREYWMTYRGLLAVVCHWTTHCQSWSGPNWQSGTILSLTSIPRYREYWMTYRGPDLLAVVLFGSSSTGDTQEDWKIDILLLGTRGGGGGEAKWYNRKTDWPSINHSVLSGTNQIYAPSSGSKREVQRLKVRERFPIEYHLSRVNNKYSLHTASYPTPSFQQFIISN